MTPRVSWLGDSTVPPADFLQTQAAEASSCSLPMACLRSSQAMGGAQWTSPRDPTTAQSARVCRLGACRWFNWFPVSDVTSIRHTGAVGLAHVLLNQHEAPRARGGSCHPLSWGSPAPGRPGPVRSPLRNANPLCSQVRSAPPRPPHPAATAVAPTCPSPLDPSHACPGPVQVSRGRAHSNHWPPAPG